MVHLSTPCAKDGTHCARRREVAPHARSVDCWPCARRDQWELQLQQVLTHVPFFFAWLHCHMSMQALHGVLAPCHGFRRQLQGKKGNPGH